MLFPPPDVLAKADQSTAFIALTWQELFDDETPDTFQPRLLNVPSIVDELASVARLACFASVWEKHLQEIRDELKDLLSYSSSLLNAFPKYRWAIEHLVSLTSANDIERHARILSDEYQSFDAFYVENLHRGIGEMPAAKENLQIAIANLASCAARSDRRRSSFTQLIREESFSLSPAALAEMLCERTRTRVESFRFIAAVLGKQSDVQAILRGTPGLQLLPEHSKPTGDLADRFFSTYSGYSHVCGSVEADDVSAAAKIALREVGIVLDTFNFFRNRISLQAQNDLLILPEDGGKDIQLINVHDESLGRLRPRRDARPLTQHTIQALLGNRLEGRLLNALELHALAHASFASRVRLVNLWSALECLLPQTIKKSRVELLVELVAPLLASRRVDKIVTYLAISLHRYRTRYKRVLKYADGFENSKRHVVRSTDLLHVLAKPSGHDHPKKLADFASHHQLLRYRLFRAWSALSRPSELRKELIASERRVRWQLYRIYRARNLSVHHGDNVPFVGPMLDCLQYYFSVTLTRVLEEMAHHAHWDVEDATASIARKAAYLRDTLVDAPSRLLTEDFIHLPDARAGERLWP